MSQKCSEIKPYYAIVARKKVTLHGFAVPRILCLELTRTDKRGETEVELIEYKTRIRGRMIP